MHFSYTNCEGQSLTAAHLIFSPFLWPNFSRIFWPFSLFTVAVIDNVREVPLFHSPHPPVYIFLCTLLFWFCIFSLSFKYNNLSPSSFAFALELLFIVGCYLLSFTKYCSLRFLLCVTTQPVHIPLFGLSRAFMHSLRASWKPAFQFPWTLGARPKFSFIFQRMKWGQSLRLC